MRIRTAQRLIFGSLALLTLLFMGSVWVLSMKARSAANPTESAPGEVARLSTNWEYEIPGKEIWADTGALHVSREIENYALAGTFQTFEREDGSDIEFVTARSLALVDDQRSKKQFLLREGDTLGPFSVEKVGIDQITLMRDDQVFVLALTGEIASAPAQESAPQNEEAPVRLEDMPALESNRFGKRVSENQWVIDRQEVFGYAEEIMGNPLRATQLYRSFTQMAKEEGDEAGFKIQMKGEKEFFGDMGLGDGDIIRKVNSMQMKTQIRAEYLVREFMRSRMSAVVLDIENNGETRQQIFIVR